MEFLFLNFKSFLAHSFPVILVRFCLSFLCCVALSAGYAQLPSGFIREQIATGLNPTSMVLAPDGRIFITEKNGTIRIIRDDQLLETPFLTLEVDDSNERGLGHMVLHTDFDQNGFFYIFYSVPGSHYNRISRFKANGDFTIPGSETVIINLDILGAEIHNGGDMVFGFDGYLYVGTGDGGQNWRGEDLGSTNGKVLRIDEYGNPHPANPWFDLNYLRANLVYAYGFRNPYTMTIHPLTGEIYVNDVGGSKFEEINKLEEGGFFGWPIVEGKRTTEVVPASYKNPVFQYSHANDYCAIVGSTFYFPLIQQFPEQYYGKYFYSDYCTGRIRILDTETAMDHGVFITDGDRVIDLDVSADGSLYYLERKGLGDGSPEDNAGTNEGTVWKVSYTGSGAPFISLHPHSVLAAIGETATFSVIASGAMPLTYTWLLNGEELKSADGPILLLEDVVLDQDSLVISVEVHNEFGLVVSDEVLLRVTSNKRPEPIITSPAAGATYKAGNVISFSGMATDAEDGALNSASLSWRIDFHHASHTHPALSWTSGIDQGIWMVPSLGETSSEVWYRLYLRAADQQGFSKVIYRDIFPELGKINISSVPEALVINLDGAPVITPFEIEGVRGISRYVSPPYKQISGDSIYFFKRWQDDYPDIQREVKTNDTDQFLIAEFEAIRQGTGFGLTAYYYDNPRFEGEPLVKAIDPVIDHQYLWGPPLPGLPEDNFSIRWKGYIQPYKTGVYHFTISADDGIFVEIGGQPVIQNWETGVHQEEASLFLETGWLYPIHIRLYEWLSSSQIKVRWSSPDFPEEVVPSSQFYPEDYLSDEKASGMIVLQSLSADQLQVVMESFKDTRMDFSIINMTGHTIDYSGYWVPVGRNIITFDISYLPAGLYYFQGVSSENGQRMITPFVKAK